MTPRQFTIAIVAGSALAGAVGYGALTTGWQALVDAAANQAQTRRLVSDQTIPPGTPQLPHIYRIGNGGE